MSEQISGRSEEQQRGESYDPASRADGSTAPQPRQSWDEERGEAGWLAIPTESSALLGNVNGQHDPENGERKKGRDWDELPAPGDPSWAREIKIVLMASPPLIITFFLQFSINATSVFAVGKLGKQQLAAVACKYNHTILCRHTHTMAAIRPGTYGMHANSA